MAPPPGPRTPALVQTVRYLIAPERTLEAARRRYGPVFRMRFLGFPPEVFVTGAELADRVYATDAGGGRAGEVARQFLEPVVGRHSLLTLDGEPWRRHRKLLGPPLHGRAVARWEDEIAGIARAEIGRWPLHRPFALRDRMQDITLEVILRLVFGIRDTRRLARLRALIPRLVDVGSSAAVLMMPPALRAWTLESPAARRLAFLPTTRFLRVRDAVDAILYDEIAQRRAAPDPEATDVLSLLVAARDEQGRPMTDQELRDELITLLEAGHETTATGLAWAFERLVRTPHALRRLRAELDAQDAGTQDAGTQDARTRGGAAQDADKQDTGAHRGAARDGGAYLDAVVKEALRSRTVVYDVPRLIDEPLDLGGYLVPKGWFASPLIMLVHRDPDAFPDPEAFRPERFLGADAARANRSWMPFGGGRRYCVGAQLALLEMRVIIREVLRAVELRAEDPAPERARVKHVTLVPARRARVVARARTAPPPEAAAEAAEPSPVSADGTAGYMKGSPT